MLDMLFAFLNHDDMNFKILNLSFPKFLSSNK